MKPLFAIFIACTVAGLGCKKSSDNSVDNGCIERVVIKVTDHSISPSNVLIANNLFSSNNIDYSHYRYFRYIQDSVQPNPAGPKYFQQLVEVDRYINGVKNFSGEWHFSFKNGILDTLVGVGYPYSTKLDTIPHLALPRLRKLFLDDIQRFYPNGSKYKDSCFKAEFGYYNYNTETSYSPNNLIKVWRLSLQAELDPLNLVFPIAWYRDSDGKLIHFDDGLRAIYQ